MESFWSDIRKLPNIITLIRLIFGAPVTIILYKNGFEYAWLIFLFFAWLDWLDGKIARRQKSVTSLGMRLDPLADQFLVLPIMWHLAYVSVWTINIPLILTLREAIMLLMRWTTNKDIPAMWIGKIKMICEYIGVCCLLLGGQFYFYGFFSFGLAVVFAIISLIIYFFMAVSGHDYENNRA